MSASVTADQHVCVIPHTGHQRAALLYSFTDTSTADQLKGLLSFINKLNALHVTHFTEVELNKEASRKKHRVKPRTLLLQHEHCLRSQRYLS